MTTEAAAYTTLAFVLAVAVAWSHAWWARGRYEDHREALRAEHAARPPGPHPAAVEDEIALGLHALTHSCCLTAAVTNGADHDHPTRKDQTT